MKKIISLLLSLVLCFSLVSVAFAGNGYDYDDDYDYDYDEDWDEDWDEYEDEYDDFYISEGVLYEYYGYDDVVVVPEGVITLAQNCLENCEMTELVLPDSLQTIEKEALYGCEYLETVTIPKNVKTIGIWVFDNCYNLTSINVAAGNAYFKSVNGVLYDAKGETLIRCPAGKNLTGFQLPATVKKLGDSAFYQCSLSEIDLTSVTYIDDYALDQTGLESVTLGAGLTYVGKSAFSETWLEDVYYEGSSAQWEEIEIGSGNNALKAAEIHYYAGDEFSDFLFDGDTVIAYYGDADVVVVPDGVITLAQNCLENCEMTELVLPDSLEVIETNAIYQCKNLKTVTLPKNVRETGEWIFSGCGSLTGITVAADNQYFKSVDGVLYNKAGTTLLKYPEGKNAARFQTPGTVTTVGRCAFIYSGLTEVDLTNVTEIGQSAFGYNAALKSVTLGAGLTCIDDLAFYGTSLENVYYAGNGIQWDGIEIGYGNDELDEATIHYAGGDCKDFVYKNGVLTNYLGSDARVVVPEGITELGESCFSYKSFITELVLPDSLLKIDDKAIFYCRNLKTVTIPKNVDTIGGRVFDGDSSLTAINVASGNQYYKSVGGVLYDKAGTLLVKYPEGKSAAGFTLPATVKIIGAGAFNGTDLTTFTVSDNVTEIRDNAFSSCLSLTGLTLGKNLKTLGNYAFSDCEKLTAVTLPASLETLGSTILGCQVFESCAALKSISVASGSQNFKSVNGVLYDVAVTTLIKFPAGKSAAGFTLPATVTKLGTNAFSGSGITEIDLTNVVTIMSYALSDCASLKSVTFGTALSYVGIGAFSGSTAPQDIWYPGSYTQLKAVTIKTANNSLNKAKLHIALSDPGEFEIEDGVLLAYTGRAEKVAVPDGVKTLAAESMKGVSGMTELTLPASLEKIEEYAVSSCVDLTSVTIPKNVSQIGACAFYGDDSLTAIQVASGNQNFKSVNGALYDKAGTKLLQFPAGKPTAGFTLPATVKTIGAYAFSGTDMTSFTVGDSVEVIEEGAFGMCPNLTEIHLGSGVKVLGNKALALCQKLTSVTLPASLETLGNNVFSFCDSLKAIHTEQGSSFFASVDGVLYNADLTMLIKYPEGKSAIGYTLPATVLALDIGSLIRCGFYELDLTNVLLIGAQALYECKALRKVVFGMGLTGVGQSAFYGDTALRDVRYPGSYTQWSEISIASGNDTLYNAPKHFAGGLPLPDAERVSVGATYVADLNVNMSSFSMKYGKDGTNMSNYTGFDGWGRPNVYECYFTLVTGASGFEFFFRTGSSSYRFSAEPYTAYRLTWAYGVTVSSYSAGTKTFTWIDSNGRSGSVSQSYSGAILTNERLIVTRIKQNTPSTPFAPTVQAAVTAANTVSLSWNAVANAARYDVYRYNGTEKKYLKIGSTFGTGYDVTGLSGDVTYYFKVKAVNEVIYGDDVILDYESAFSEAVNAKAIGVPAAPTGMKVKPTAEKTLTVSWNAVSGATQYNVYRYNGTKKAYVYIGTSLTTEYAVEDLTVGTEYYFKVVAVRKESGLTLVSPLSAAASAMALGALAAPANVKVKPTADKELTVTWSAVKGATQYNVYRYNGTAYQYIGTTLTTDEKPTQYADTGLTVGTTYYYKVLAAGKGNGLTFTSDKSAYACTMALGALTAPANVKVKPTAEKELTVTWSAVKGATQYNVYRYNGTAYQYIGTTLTSDEKPTQYADAGLTVGTTYYYKVLAAGKGNGLTFTSDKSAYACTMALGALAVPANVKVKPTADKELTVTWSAVKGATQYNVYRYNGTAYQYIGTTLTSDEKPTQYVDADLTVGTTYYYKVLAAGKGNGLTFTSDKSAYACTMALGALAAPANVKVKPTAEKELTVTWSAVKGATQYNVYRYNGTAYQYIGTTLNSDEKPTQYVDIDLTVGTTYYYKVVAAGKGNGLTFISDQSAFANTMALGALSAPTNVKASAAGSKTIAVTWSAVRGATQYNVYRYNGTAYQYIGTTLTSDEKPTRYEDGDRTAGIDYYYKVVAVGKGNGLTFQSEKSAFAHVVATA